MDLFIVKVVVIITDIKNLRVWVQYHWERSDFSDLLILQECFSELQELYGVYV